VRKAEGQGWLLMRDAKNIRASELLLLFVLEGGSFFDEQSDDPLRKWFFSCASQLKKSTDLSLRELIART
ncbi:MAG: ribonuclease BN, partial [Gallionella sp.]